MGIDPTFREYGLRSWIPPFILAGYLKVLWLFGLRTGVLVLPIVRCTTASLTCVGLGAYAWGLGQHLKLRQPAWLAAAVLFFIPDVVHYGATCELSVLAMPLLLVGFAFVLTKMHRLGSLLVVASALIRFQFGVFSAVLLVWYLWRRETRRALELVVFGAALLALDFAFESWRYGHPILPLWTYFTANTVGGLAATYGITPFYSAFELMWRFSTEPVFLLILFTLPLTLRRFPFIAGGGVLFFLIHTVVGHKEYRFFYAAVIVLAGASAAVFQQWLEKAPKGRRFLFAKGVVAGFLTVFAVFATWRATTKTGWHEFEIPAKLETQAGSLPDYYGSITYGWSGVRYGGNYTVYSARPYVFAQSHRELLTRKLNPRDYNYVIAPTSERAPCKEIRAREGDSVLYRCTIAEVTKLVR